MLIKKRQCKLDNPLSLVDLRLAQEEEPEFEANMRIRVIILFLVHFKYAFGLLETHNGLLLFGCLDAAQGELVVALAHFLVSGPAHLQHVYH